MTREEIDSTLIDIQGKLDAIVQSLSTAPVKVEVEDDNSLIVGDVLKDTKGILWVCCAITQGEQAWLFSRENGGLLTHRKNWQSDCIDFGFEKTDVHTGMIDDMFDSIQNVNYVN
jgi:hypothetical protein